MDFLKTSIRQTVSLAAIYFVFGLFFVIKPDMAADVVGRAIAIAILLLGIIETVIYFVGRHFIGRQRNSFALGLIAIILGIFLISKPDVIINISGYILAFTIIISGILQFQYALDLRHFSFTHPIFPLIMGIAVLVMGFIALVNPFDTVKTFMTVIGVELILSAICDIVAAVFFAKCLKEAKKLGVPEVIEVEASEVHELDTPSENV